jgi:hypothetical protein
VAVDRFPTAIGAAGLSGLFRLFGLFGLSRFFHDTALDHMAAMDENEGPVEVHLTKN